MSADTKPIHGVDISVFPGGTAMDWLRKNANARFACFYLGPTDSHGDASWMSQRTSLTINGWGLIPTYLGQQARVKKSGVWVPNPALSAARGKTDGGQACDFMKNAGFALGTVVYLDLEQGDRQNNIYRL